MWHKSNYQKQLETCSRKMAQQVSVPHTSRITHTRAQNPCNESLLVIMCNLWSLHSCSSVGDVERKENDILWAARRLTKGQHKQWQRSRLYKFEAKSNSWLLSSSPTNLLWHTSIHSHLHTSMYARIHTYRKKENWRKEESGIISGLPIEWL